MVAGVIVLSALLTLLLADFLVPKSGKTPEEKLGEALADYLKAGGKIRKEEDAKK